MLPTALEPPAAENSGRGVTGGAFVALSLITALPPPFECANFRRDEKLDNS